MFSTEGAVLRISSETLKDALLLENACIPVVRAVIRYVCVCVNTCGHYYVLLLYFLSRIMLDVFRHQINNDSLYNSIVKNLRCQAQWELEFGGICTLGKNLIQNTTQ